MDNVNPPPNSAPPRAETLVPPSILQRVIDRPYFVEALARYTEMHDDDLYRATEVCLRNLDRLVNEGPGPDAELRLVLVPELWERLRPGTRDTLRRITTSLAEHQEDAPSIFWPRITPETRARLRGAAADLRQRITAAAELDAPALVEKTRFAMAGSRAANTWPPDYPVYEPGFTYRLVPAIAHRVLVQKPMLIRLPPQSP